MRTTWHFRSESKDAISLGYRGTFPATSELWGNGGAIVPEFRDREVHWRKFSEVELLGLACLLPVPVDHSAGLMTGPIADPRFGLAICQIDRDERAPQV